MRVDINQVIGQFIILFILFALCLFVPAGTLTWVAGWIFLFLFFGFFLGVNVWLYRHNPGLLQERLRIGRSDQKGWDKFLFPVLLVIPFVMLILIALDAARFHWSSVPLWVQVFGGLVLLASFYLFFLTFRENSFLSTVVRIQQDRGHTVVSTGPYHYVRHPMYAGIVLFALGTPLLLGSWLGVLFGLLLILILARRAVLEENTLRQELQGYAAYMTRVKYRIIPYVW